MKVFLSGKVPKDHGYAEYVNPADYPEGLTESSIRRRALADMLECSALHLYSFTPQSKWELLTARFIGLPVIGDSMLEEENLSDILDVVGSAGLSVWDVMRSGHGKYPPGEWKNWSHSKHLTRAARHTVTAIGQLDGDFDEEDHAANALSRLAMVMANRCG